MLSSARVLPVTPRDACCGALPGIAFGPTFHDDQAVEIDHLTCPAAQVSQRSIGKDGAVGKTLFEQETRCAGFEFVTDDIRACHSRSWPHNPKN